MGGALALKQVKAYATGLMCGRDRALARLILSLRDDATISVVRL